VSASSILIDDAGAAAAYDALASAYDVLTSEYRHDLWLEKIEQLARSAGLAGHRLLDIACGTGKSFLPLLRGGYKTTACDISEEMVRIAREKGPEAHVLLADMRSLGRIGEFDLITCLDDAVNYLLSEEDLDRFLQGVSLNLAPAGIAAFDVNSLKMYRDGFARDWIVDDASAFVAWTARDAAETQIGDQVEATVHIFAPSEGGWQRRASTHHQRHWPEAEIVKCAKRAPLRVIGPFGQRRGAVIDGCFDELEHTKALYLATHTRKGAEE
jgi:SAM-dependent methyltransferase